MLSVLHYKYHKYACFIQKGSPRFQEEGPTKKATQTQGRKTALEKQKQGKQKQAIKGNSDEDSSSDEETHQPHKKCAKKSQGGDASVEEVDAEEPVDSEIKTVLDKEVDGSDNYEVQ